MPALEKTPSRINHTKAEPELPPHPGEKRITRNNSDATIQASQPKRCQLQVGAVNNRQYTANELIVRQTEHSNRFASYAQNAAKLLTNMANLIKRILGCFMFLSIFQDTRSFN